jgi:hypothetical protein
VDDQPAAAKPYRLRTILAVVVFILVAGGVAWPVYHYEANRPHFQVGHLPSITVQSPVRSTEAWFEAINAHNMPLAEAHFASRDRDQMKWSSWGPPFQHLHCVLSSKNSGSAVVGCSFKAIYDADAGMSGDSGWGVSLQKQSSGRWLITSYGQG